MHLQPVLLPAEIQWWCSTLIMSSTCIFISYTWWTGGADGAGGSSSIPQKTNSPFGSLTTANLFGALLAFDGMTW